MRHRFVMCWVAVCGFMLPSIAGAANRIEVEDLEVATNSSDNEVRVMLEADQAILGFSIYLEFDDNDITINEVTLGDDVVGLAPEWNDGAIDNGSGELSWAVVFDFSGPTLDKTLAAGADLHILTINFDVNRSTASTETFNLTNVNTVEPRRLNVMTDEDGGSVNPTLADGSVTVRDFSPSIDAVTPNEGEADTVVIIEGSNLTLDGTVVRICDAVVAHEVLGSALRVTSPECGPGEAEVEVCTDFGCGTSSFTYPAPPDGPNIDGQAIPNTGAAGDTVLLTIEDADFPETVILVCGVEADYQVLGDRQTFRITIPACATLDDWAQLRVTTPFGFDLLNEGFFYEEQGNQFERGDTNGDGNVDLSDGVATLNWLFLGGTEPGCKDAADSNDLGGVDLADAVFTFNWLFLGGSEPPAPTGSCGRDPTDSDGVDCAVGHACN